MSRQRTFGAAYVIINTINGHRYVGSTVYYKKRVKDHKNDLLKGKHHSGHLQKAWNKYGAEAFEFKPVIICERDELTRYEQALMDLLKPEYNIFKFAHSARGWTPSEETKQKISKSNLGKKKSPEHCANLSKALKGRKISPEAIEKVAASHRGKKRSPEVGANISKGKTGKKNKKKFSAETIEVRRRITQASWDSGERPRKMPAVARQRMSEAGLRRVARERELGIGRVGAKALREAAKPPEPPGKPPRKEGQSAGDHRKELNVWWRENKLGIYAVDYVPKSRKKRASPSAETRKKISDTLTGRPVSEHVKQRAKAFHTGRKRSPETCAAISKGLTGQKRGRPTPEAIENNRQANLGRVKRPEEIDRMREAALRRDPEVYKKAWATKRLKKAILEVGWL